MTQTAAVIGGGPAGLMAASVLAQAGIAVNVYEAKPSVARKFLMAGKSGLNLTKDQNFEDFLSAYGADAEPLRPILEHFDARAVQIWAQGLGQTLFTGSSGRVFPVAMKASPLLRAWLARLDASGVTRHTRWRFTGWQGKAVCFDTPEGPKEQQCDVTILAMGGASWSRLGSDGEWAKTLSEQSVDLVPFQGDNLGIRVAWSAKMAPYFGAPLKAVAWSAAEQTSRGEAVISQQGLEGGGIYPFSRALQNGATLWLDLMPDHSLETLCKRLSQPRGKASVSNFLRKTLKLPPLKIALLQEWARPLPQDPRKLALQIKALPVGSCGLQPMDQAISTRGGVSWTAVNADLMLRAKSGVFCAGEMLDWSAPTGGYLLTACLATGHWAGRAALRFMGVHPSPPIARVIPGATDP